MCKKEKPRAGRSVSSTRGSVTGLSDGHSLDPLGWWIMKQNGFRETWAGSCCQLGKQGFGDTRIWVPAGRGTAGTLIWDSNIFNWHQSRDSRIIHSAAAGVSGSGW